MQGIPWRRRGASIVVYRGYIQGSLIAHRAVDVDASRDAPWLIGVLRDSYKDPLLIISPPACLLGCL